MLRVCGRKRYFPYFAEFWVWFFTRRGEKQSFFFFFLSQCIPRCSSTMRLRLG